MTWPEGHDDDGWSGAARAASAVSSAATEVLEVLEAGLDQEGGGRDPGAARVRRCQAARAGERVVTMAQQPYGAAEASV